MNGLLLDRCCDQGKADLDMRSAKKGFSSVKNRRVGYAAIMVDDTFHVVGDKVLYKNVAATESCRFENSTMICKEHDHAPISYGSTKH